METLDITLEGLCTWWNQMVLCILISLYCMGKHRDFVAVPGSGKLGLIVRLYDGS